MEKKNETSQRSKGISTLCKDLSLQKEGERFLFRYEPGSEENILDSFIDMANDPTSNFDWFDAAVLSFQLSKNLVAEADELLCR
jgi:hypothetical protein